MFFMSFLRSLAARTPCLELDQGEEVFGQPVQQIGLLQVDEMAGCRRDGQPDGRTSLLQEQASFPPRRRPHRRR